MNLQSVLLTGVAIAAFAWALAFDAHAQTTTSPLSAQETPVPAATQAGDSNVIAPKHTKHRAHRLPTDDSTPAEKAVTARLNEQQLEGTSLASNRTAPPEPNMPGNAPSDGPADSSAVPPPPTQPNLNMPASSPNQPSASSPPQ